MNKTKVAILFLTYGNEYEGAYERFLHICEDISYEKKLIVIHNDDEDMPCSGRNEWIYDMGGDNSCFEFSGWQKGVESDLVREFDPDVYIFANSAFICASFDTTPLVDNEILEKIYINKVFAGNIRKFVFDAEYEGKQIAQYIPTHFFVMHKEIMTKLGSLVSERSSEKFINKEYSNDLFRDNGMFSAQLKKYIFWILTHKYHAQGQKFTPEQYGFFKRKILNVMNEIILSERVALMGFKFLNITPFSRFLSSFYIIFLPFTTISPFRFLRKIFISVIFLKFFRAVNRKKFVYKRAFLSVKKAISKQLAKQ